VCHRTLSFHGFLCAAYYRGAQGIIYVFDVTRRETFESLADIWMHEVDMYSTVADSIKMIVANKTDLEDLREVTRSECIDFAKKHGCLFVETSAKDNVAVDQAFEELVMKVLETPSLLEGPSTGLGLKKAAKTEASSCC
jgi:Ras-related protein Rab-18